MNLTRTLLLVTCLLLPGIASGQSVCGPWCQAIVKVVSTRGQLQKHGSGTLVDVGDGPGLVVTAAHVLGSGFDPMVIFSSGARCKATILATDALHDCALLTIQVPRGVQGMPLAKTYPRQGERLTWAGYGGQQGFATGMATVAGYEPGDWLSSRGRVRNGDSGGPLYTAAGLVGIVCELGGGPGEPWVIEGPQCLWIRRFIERARTRRAPPPLVAVTPPPLKVEPKESVVCIELRTRIVALEKLVATLEITIGKSGPAGPAGPRGEPGTNADPQILEDLASEIRGNRVLGTQALEEANRPIYVRRRNTSTGEEVVEEIRLGDNFILYQKPLIVKRVNTATGEETIEEINFQDGEGLIFLMTPHE